MIVVKKRSGQSGSDGNNQLRTKTVKFLCSPDEHELLVVIANEAGYKSISQYVREQSLNDKYRLSRAERNALLRCQKELVRIGNHCADVIRHLHMDSDVDRAVYGAVKDIKKYAYLILESASNGEWGKE